MKILTRRRFSNVAMSSAFSLIRVRAPMMRFFASSMASFEFCMHSRSKPTFLTSFCTNSGTLSYAVIGLALLRDSQEPVGRGQKKISLDGGEGDLYPTSSLEAVQVCMLRWR